MSLPFFFVEHLPATSQNLILEEDQSKHIVQVLRKQKGDEILLTDGKGSKALVRIIDDHRKQCQVKINSIEKEAMPLQKVSIAISLLKNASRFEWFLEKATEIGVNEIIPLICVRTEREKFRVDRLQNILVSAMLQSQQCWLPLLHELISFENLIEENREGKKFIAHCLPEQKQQLTTVITHVGNSMPDLQFQTPNSRFPASDSLILIGPEGDFTEGEIELALQKNFIAVALGKTRLRTETAGIVAAITLLQMRD